MVFNIIIKDLSSCKWNSIHKFDRRSSKTYLNLHTNCTIVLLVEFSCSYIFHLLKTTFPMLRYRLIHPCHCNCCLWSKMSSLLLLLFITLLYPCAGIFEFCTGTGTCVSVYTSTLLYLVAGASTSSHGELYSPSTTLQHKEWFSPAVQMKVHISAVRQGILTVLFAVCLYPTVLGLSRMSFSA